MRGRLYEAALDDDRDEFDAASKAFASNLESADRLSERARGMLGAPAKPRNPSPQTRKIL